MLEEHDQIDAVTRSEAGDIQLVIMDAGLTEDADERHGHLVEKLRTYVAYAASPEFREQHPDVPVDGVSILVMCRIPPTEKMLSTTSVARTDHDAEALQVSFRHFPGSDEDDDEDEEQKIDTPPVKTAEQDSFSSSSSVPVHITFGVLLLFLVARQYLVFTGAASKLHTFNEARAVGASLGYLFIWSLGYWFCVTTPRKAFVTWLGGAAVILSTLIVPFVGFALLLVIYLTRRSQRRR